MMGIAGSGSLSNACSSRWIWVAEQQVLAAGHQADLLMGIIHHHRQMIGGRHVLARDHHIAKAKGSTA
jgi:hypothetical protein